MNIQRWIAQRQPRWKELESLLGKAEHQGLKSLKANELRQLSSLYRSVSADLARARTNQVGEVVTQDLQTLTSRGYALIYQGSRRQEWQAILEFYLWGFPAAVQQAGGYIALATALFVFAGAFRGG